jgi:hypothetical protein
MTAFLFNARECAYESMLPDGSIVRCQEDCFTRLVDEAREAGLGWEEVEALLDPIRAIEEGWEGFYLVEGLDD